MVPPVWRPLKVSNGSIVFSSRKLPRESFIVPPRTLTP